MNYWLFKTEPNAFSIVDLQKAKNQTTQWEGVRNYQSRNFLRDSIKVGDRVLFYHSRVEPMSVVGIVEVVRGGYPDFFSFDPTGKYFDPKSTVEKPVWYMVDVRLIEVFQTPVTLKQIKSFSELQDMFLLKKGARLSIQPVTQKEYEFITKLSKIENNDK
jgi:predicted RNA-binding protein with PUA-like domain